MPDNTHTTNGIVNGLAAYNKSLGNREANKKYSEGWDRIFGEKKKKINNPKYEKNKIG